MSNAKSLNQLREQDVDVVAEILGKKDFDRLLIAQDLETPLVERVALIRKIASNQIVKSRREARRELRTINVLNAKKSELQKQLKAEKEKIFKNQFEIQKIESFIASLNEIIRSTLNVLAALGKLVTINLEWYGLVATDNDFAQLINANMQEVAKCRIDYEISEEHNHSFFVHLIFVQNIESEPGQPLFEVMSHMFQKEMVENRRAKDKAEELFPGLKHLPRYALNKDDQGNLTAKQIYKPLELV